MPVRHPMRLRGQLGFTVIEFMVVVAATALLLAIIIPSALEAVESNALRQAAVVVANELRRAQAEAMAQGMDYTVEFHESAFTEGGGWMRVWKQGVSTPVREIRPPKFPMGIQTFDADADFNNCLPPADPGNRCVIFKPLGYPVQGGKVELRSIRSGAEYKVVVAPATGRISVQR